MNQSIWQKLKRVKWSDLFHVFLYILAIPFAYYFRKTHPNLWLLCDCKQEARDNAYWFFYYITQTHPEQEAVFALDPHSPDVPRISKLGKRIDFGSFRHWIYYLAAQNVISSQKTSGPNAAVCYVLERLRLIKCNKVFLQHGIIKDCLSFLYYEYTHIRLFTCSVQREWDYVQNFYGYPKGYVQLLGLCRFDHLISNQPCKPQIVIMPTWRKWLSHPTGRFFPYQLREQFQQSSFFACWNSWIHNPSFQEFLETHDLQAVFYLHREMQKYKALFSSDNIRIKIASYPEYDVQELLKESLALITDYSSVAMDFAYMEKPLLYYQFDYQEFRKFHLEEGYFDYEKDGFGKVCQTEETLLHSLKELQENNFISNPIYKKRRTSFFTLRDQNNCARTYEAIQNLDR